MSTLSLLSYNIHKGRSGLRQRRVIEPLREAIRGTGADIVFLQEVRGEGDPTVMANQFEYLADEIWSHFAYGKNAVYSRGDHGNAILSKYPIERFSNLDLSLHRLEKRGLLHAEIQIGGQPFHLLNTHLNLRGADRKRQFLKVNDYISQQISQTEPFILAGDFNDWRGEVSRLVASSWRELTPVSRTGSFPAFAPLLRLDRAFGRGVSLARSSVLRGAPWERLSDHLPLYFEVEIEAESSGR